MKKEEIEEKLRKVISKEKGSWLEDTQYWADNEKWLKRSQSIAITVHRTLRAKGLNQRDLAALMNRSAQQVNRWLKGSENFTLETIAKLEEALGIELMNVTNIEDKKETTTIKLTHPKKNIQPSVTSLSSRKLNKVL
jgi:transcriptional regulator with XRE-family HTH domain